MWWHKPHLVQLEDGYWYIRRGNLARWLVSDGFWEYKDWRINSTNPEEFWWGPTDRYIKDCRFKTVGEAREYWARMISATPRKPRVIGKEPL